MKYIRVVADSNDGDYRETFKEATEDDTYKVRRVAAAIKGFQPYVGDVYDGNCQDTHAYNWPSGECLREDMGEWTPSRIYAYLDNLVEYFEEKWLPYDEYGIHTIESIEIFEVSEKERLV